MDWCLCSKCEIQKNGHFCVPRGMAVGSVAVTCSTVLDACLTAAGQSDFSRPNVSPSKNKRLPLIWHRQHSALFKLPANNSHSHGISLLCKTRHCHPPCFQWPTYSCFHTKRHMMVILFWYGQILLFFLFYSHVGMFYICIFWFCMHSKMVFVSYFLMPICMRTFIESST